MQMRACEAVFCGVCCHANDVGVHALVCQEDLGSSYQCQGKVTEAGIISLSVSVQNPSTVTFLQILFDQPLVKLCSANGMPPTFPNDCKRLVLSVHTHRILGGHTAN